MAIWCKEGHCNHPQVIHKTPVHQWMPCEIKSYVVNKQINQDVFNFKPLHWSKMSSIHNIAFLSESGEKYAQTKLHW